VNDQELTILLSRLAEATYERPREGFAEEVKDHIPRRLIRHRVHWDSVNIVIDLRLNRLAAAAAIVIAVLVLVGLFAREPGGDSMYMDGKLLLKYGLGGEEAWRSELLKSLGKFCEELARQGREVVFYGESTDPKDVHSIVMHWRLPDGQYRVVFNDLTARSVSATSLIRLQSRMLQERTRK
jgi:hypothetical protein